MSMPQPSSARPLPQSMFLRMSMPEPPELVAFKDQLAESAKVRDEEMAATVDAETTVAQPAGRGSVAALSARTPLFRLLKGHWDSLALHFMLVIWLPMAFFAFTGWLPGFYRSHGVAALITQGMQVASLCACAFTVLLTGYLCDKGLPCMPTYAAAVLVRSI